MPIKNDQWLDQIVSAGHAQPLFRKWPQAYREFQVRCPKNNILFLKIQPKRMKERFHLLCAVVESASHDHRAAHKPFLLLK
jgi:hypothetical protein